MKILAIIPAKTDSTRLPKKNLREIDGKTLIEHSIEFALASDDHEVDIIVSSECSKVLDIVMNRFDGIYFHQRPKYLLRDAEVVDVYLDVLRYMISEYEKEYDLIIGLQPDHPDRSFKFDHYVNYMINENYDDLICIEPNYKRSGSVRIFKADHLMRGHVSKRIGTICDDATDIHYEEDLNKAKLKLESK